MMIMSIEKDNVMHQRMKIVQSLRSCGLLRPVRRAHTNAGVENSVDRLLKLVMASVVVVDIKCVYQITQIPVEQPIYPLNQVQKGYFYS